MGGELMKPHRRQSDGALLAEGIAIREGVLEYRRADGSIRKELVTLAAVLDTARTLPRSALTLGHPEVTGENPDGFVRADNAGKLVVGDIDGTPEVGGVKKRADGEYESDYEDAQGAYVKVKYAIRRKDAIDAVEAGNRETSCGYKVILDETPGLHPVFGRYDAAQVGRECNHDAVGIPKGRAGATVALRIDADDAVQVVPLGGSPAPIRFAPPSPSARADTHEVTMKPGLLALLAALGVGRFDSEEAALDAALVLAKQYKADAADVAQFRKDAEEMAAKETEEETELDKAKKDLAARDIKIAELEKKLGGLEKAESDRKDAADLAELRTLAGKVNVKHDGLTLPALRLAVAKTRVDSLDDKTAPAIVDGVLLGIKSEVAKRDAADPNKRDTRWDFGGKGKGDNTRGDDGKPGEQRDQFYNPHLDHADKARQDSIGGEA